MPKVLFDGVNRRIYVNSDVTTLDVGADLYSEWKRWLVSDLQNTKYPPAFRVSGGDQISEGEYAPRYYFLINGWRVVVDGISITVKSNLYTEEGDSPFIVINNGSVMAKNADVPIVIKEVQQENPNIDIIRKLVANKAVRDGNIIVIYDDDGDNVYRRYDITNGNRIPL